MNFQFCEYLEYLEMYTEYSTFFSFNQLVSLHAFLPADASVYIFCSIYLSSLLHLITYFFSIQTQLRHKVDHKSTPLSLKIEDTCIRKE